MGRLYGRSRDNLPIIFEVTIAHSELLGRAKQKCFLVIEDELLAIAGIKPNEFHVRWSVGVIRSLLIHRFFPSAGCWHITLGAWFKNYVYYPVSLSKPCKSLTKRAWRRFGRVVGPSMLSQPKNNQAMFGMYEPVANGAIGEPENTIDVLFVGDSEVYATYSPLQMWHEHGFTSYDASCAGQKLTYGNTLLRRTFSKQSPRVVVFETNSLFTEFSLGEGVTRIAEDLCPLFGYHNRWKTLTQADFSSPVQATWTDEFRGFTVNRGIKAADVSEYGTQTDKILEVPGNNRTWLGMMVDFCRKHGAIPLLMSSPSPVNWNMAKHHGIQKLADELGVTYVDLNLVHEELGIDWQRDTYDAGDHLNYDGAVKVSRYVGGYLSKSFALADRRDDMKYSEWDAAYERFIKQVQGT